MPVINFLKPHMVSLDVFSSYACSDAAAFSGCINPDQKINVMNRLVRAQERKAKGVGMIGGFQINTNWNADALENIYDRVIKERYGECTTFAKAAAHILTQGNNIKPRIEIVAYTNHVFLIVGRIGGYITVGRGFKKKEQLPAINTWGGDWALIDPWAGAMGYPDIIYIMQGLHVKGVGFKGEYPFPDMLDPISLVMQREAG